MKRNLRAKMRRGRGIQGATTVSGMLQGLKQRAKPRMPKNTNSGYELNSVKNKNTGKLNRLRLLGKKINRRNKLNNANQSNTNNLHTAKRQ